MINTIVFDTNCLLSASILPKSLTGDKDLLVLDPFRGIPILTAADFLKKF